MQDKVRIGVAEDRFTGAIESQTSKSQVPGTWRQPLVPSRLQPF
jgi:hypothetical protein